MDGYDEAEVKERALNVEVRKQADADLGEIARAETFMKANANRAGNTVVK